MKLLSRASALHPCMRLGILASTLLIDSVSSSCREGLVEWPFEPPARSCVSSDTLTLDDFFRDFQPYYAEPIVRSARKDLFEEALDILVAHSKGNATTTYELAASRFMVRRFVGFYAFNS